jgi:hypothetical protein
MTTFHFLSNPNLYDTVVQEDVQFLRPSYIWGDDLRDEHVTSLFTFGCAVRHSRDTRLRRGEAFSLISQLELDTTEADRLESILVCSR